MTGKKMHCVQTRIGVSIMDASGALRPCCKYADPYQFDDQLNPSRIPTIFNVNTLDELHNHRSYVELKDQIGSGKNPDSCASCWMQERNGLPSRRLEMNDMYRDSIDDDNYVGDMEISLDFTCNMMCRICGPHSSSKWNSAHKVIDELRNVGADNVNRQPPGAARYREVFRNVMDNTDLSRVRSVKLQGGETFYSKNLGWFIDKIHSEVRDRSAFRMEIFTNGSIFPDDSILRKLLDFKNLQMTFSIDSIGDLATVTRWGIPWPTIANNCMRWDELGKDNPNIKLSTNTTVSMLNANRIGDVFEFFKDTRFKVNLSYLHSPSYLSMYMVPKHIREGWKLVEIDERYRDSISLHNSQLSSDILTENRFDVFLQSTAILDAHQGLRFEDVNREMHDLARELAINPAK